MPTIHVCSLARLGPTVAASGASHMVSIVNAGTPVTRPATIAAERHLFLGFDDLAEPIAGMVAPSTAHVGRFIDFLGRWDQANPLVVHCFAGISRSTAGAFIALCALAPERDEEDIAAALRRASPYAFPNPLMVEHADAILGRGGRMTRAILGIGRGVETYDSAPFMLPVRL
ncbi:MAG: tyrosine phosphatase family protein [Bauldia sp.]|nr:tyrosine phosphatase family protein [Bauldia sp.]